MEQGGGGGHVEAAEEAVAVEGDGERGRGHVDVGPRGVVVGPLAGLDLAVVLGELQVLELEERKQ